MLGGRVAGRGNLDSLCTDSRRAAPSRPVAICGSDPSNARERGFGNRSKIMQRGVVLGALSAFIPRHGEKCNIEI